MKDIKFEIILREIARKHHTTPNEVRREMQLAMDAALACDDPKIQAKWAAIPKKGGKITLEEFVAYMASRMSGE